MIQFLSPTEPNIELGFCLCLNGDQGPQFTHTHDAILRLCHSASGTHLNEHETNLLLRQCLIPKISYALHGSSFTKNQCSRINAVIHSTIVPGLRLNQHFPSAVLYGPIDYGGMEFPEIYTFQDQVQLDYLLKQLRWDKTVANDFLVTLNSVQLCLGFSHHILDLVSVTIDYLEPSYIIDLQRR